MSTSSQRWTLAGVFLGVGLVGWLSAAATTRVAAGYLALPEGAALAAIDPSGAVQPGSEGTAADGEPGADREGGEGRPATPPRPPRREPKNRYVDVVVERSIFDSSKVGRPAEEAEITGDERKSDLKVVLMATIVAEPAEYSSALITEERGASAMGFGIGDKILGEAEIIAIEPRRVIVRRADGSTEYIDMGGEAGEGREPVAGPAGPGEGEEATGITGSDGKYVVDKEVLDKILENPEQLYSQVRVVPHKNASGEVDGYRLSGIRRQSLFYQLGVKNGDIVHSVNGLPLTSMSSAMEAMNSMQSARNFSFDITRRNQKQTFEYEVR